MVKESLKNFATKRLNEIALPRTRHFISITGETIKYTAQDLRFLDFKEAGKNVLALGAFGIRQLADFTTATPLRVGGAVVVGLVLTHFGVNVPFHDIVTNPTLDMYSIGAVAVGGASHYIIRPRMEQFIGWLGR